MEKMGTELVWLTCMVVLFYLIPGCIAGIIWYFQSGLFNKWESDGSTSNEFVMDEGEWAGDPFKTFKKRAAPRPKRWSRLRPI